MLILWWQLDCGLLGLKRTSDGTNSAHQLDTRGFFRSKPLVDDIVNGIESVGLKLVDQGKLWMIVLLLRIFEAEVRFFAFTFVLVLALVVAAFAVVHAAASFVIVRKDFRLLLGSRCRGLFVGIRGKLFYSGYARNLII